MTTNRINGTAARAAIAASVTWLAMGAAVAAGDAENGAALAEQWCGSCHFISEQAALGMEGQVAPTFMEFTVEDEAAVAGVLAEYPHTEMPALADLTEQEIADLTAYIDTVAD